MISAIVALVVATPAPPSGTPVQQGQGLDGGDNWGVYCTNCSSGGGGTSSTVDVRDGGILQMQNVDILAQLALIKAKTDALDVNLSTRTKPADQQHILIDTASVAVTGTFWQSTQPVSGTFWQSTQPVSGTFWQSTQPVSIASMPSTPVTGTFWQATQPVSGTFFQATQPVSIASMPSTPVTGTFWQATQPVSATALPLPSGAATDATLSQLFDGGVAIRGPVVVANQPPAPLKNALTGAAYVDGSKAVQPISATALPLPIGAAQETGGTLSGILAQAAVLIAVEVQRGAAPPLNPFLLRCNAVRRTNCQP